MNVALYERYYVKLTAFVVRTRPGREWNGEKPGRDSRQLVKFLRAVVHTLGMRLNSTQKIIRKCL
jgi:hypothetical protein